MGRLIFVLLLLAAGVVGLGFYQGWFSFSTETADKKTNITITVDQEKIKEDKEKAQNKVQDVGHQVKDKVATPNDKPKGDSPRP